jgi:hypothetical protein
MTKGKKIKRFTMVDKTLHRKHLFSNMNPAKNRDELGCSGEVPVFSFISNFMRTSLYKCIIIV